MARLIDADALLKRVQECIPVGIFGRQERLACAEGLINSAPTISPDEVRGVGKWIRHDNYGWEDSFECSCCAEEFVMLDGATPSENGYNYCPSCGAKMEVSEDA